jgi:hypothetical protein
MRHRAPTSLDEVWLGDLLDRRSDAALLQNFLTARQHERNLAGLQTAYVLNLNAAWGHGKSFFLERFEQQLKLTGHIATSVNAWRDDSGSEPLVAVMAAIEDALRPYLSRRKRLKRVWEATRVSGGEAMLAIARGTIKKTASKFIGEGAEDLLEIYHDTTEIVPDAKHESAGPEAKDDDLSNEVGTAISQVADRLMTERLNAYKRKIKSIEFFKKNVRALIVELGRISKVKLPMFVLLDELDRCRPTYAIEMIEQVKHLFDIDGVTFVVATDTEQLAKSITAVYGYEFDGRRYLLRFFNREYQFPEPTVEEFVQYQFRINNIDEGRLAIPCNGNAIQFMSLGMVAFGLSMRDIEQCIDILRNFITTWPYPTEIELVVLVWLIVSFQQGRRTVFESLADPASDAAPPVARQWTFPFKDMREGRIRERDIAYADIFRHYKRYAKSSLEEILNKERPSDEPHAWVYDRFSKELQLLHGGLLRGGAKTPSVLNEYASRVRSLSRLTR